jgi:hypothetical protein
MSPFTLVASLPLTFTEEHRMTSAFARTLCRLLIVLMAWTPFQYAQAGMIGTETAVSTNAAAERAALVSLVNRSDIASQLQSLGIDPATARDRVDAMTDEEVRTLASSIQSAPVGADSTGVVLLILVAVGLWWWFSRR